MASFVLFSSVALFFKKRKFPQLDDG